MDRFRVVAIVAILVFSSLPVSGVGSQPPKSEYLSEIPTGKENFWEESPWWETTSRDSNRNGVVDWLEQIETEYPIGVMYDHLPTDADIELMYEIGVSVRYFISSVNGLLLGSVDSDLFPIISDFSGVLMVEPYGEVVFYGDVESSYL